MIRADVMLNSTHEKEGECDEAEVGERVSWRVWTVGIVETARGDEVVETNSAQR